MLTRAAQRQFYEMPSLDGGPPQQFGQVRSDGTGSCSVREKHEKGGSTVRYI